MFIDKLTADIERFKTQPENSEFESFNEPGEYFLKQELEYKRELAVHFQEIGNKLLDRSYDGYFEDLISLLSKQKLGSERIVQNLISYFDWGKLRDVVEQSSESGKIFLQQLRELLQAADNEEQIWQKLDEFIAWLRENGLGVAGLTKLWPTFFLFLWRPQKFIFIKPDFFDHMLDTYGLEKLGKGKPLDSNQYRRVMQSMSDLKTEVTRHLGDTDYIGLQSFLWHVVKTLDRPEPEKQEVLNNVWLIQSEPANLLKQKQLDLSFELTGTEDQVSSCRKYCENVQTGDVLVFVDPEKRDTVLGEVIVRTAELQGSLLSLSTSRLWKYRKTLSTTLNEQLICPGCVVNTQLREKKSEVFCQEYLDLVRWNFLCAWSPSYFSSMVHSSNSTTTTKDMSFIGGDRAKLRWKSKRGTVGDPIFFLRTNEFSPGLIAKARIYDTKNLGEYVWIEFEDVRTGESDSILTQSELESRFPAHQWSPGATLKKDQSEIKSSLNSLWRSVARKPKNEIYYGPPGTGKTYILREKCLAEYTGSSETVYREEHIRKTLADMNWREVIAATLHQLGTPQSVPDIIKHKYVDIKLSLSEANPSGILALIWGYLQAHTPEHCPTVKQEYRLDPGWFWKNEDKTWRFVDDFDPNETGITNYLRELHKSTDDGSSYFKRYAFVTFHQSYSYEEFVEGIRPILNRESQDVAYELRHGIFREICELARNDSSGAPYAIFIDEINRGNISKIFGELITLIEGDKREGAKNELDATLPYSKDRFTVPRNLDIFGSMNTADRSLVPIDNALRRRFTFYELMPQPELLSSITFNEVEINLSLLLEVMNERIEALFDREHMIGHAYFLSGNGTSISAQELPAVFRYKIIPLLTEYFFDDWVKVRKVLADDRAEESLQFVHEQSGNSFGKNNVYRMNHVALNIPEAYTKIYL